MSHTFFAARSTSSASQAITGGCIIVSNSAVLGFLEGPPELLHKALSFLDQAKCLSTVRVLSSTEDCQSRQFSQFGAYSFNPPSEDGVDVAAEGGATVASAVQLQLSRITFPEAHGEAIAGLPKVNANSVPSAARTAACSKSELFPEAGEYLEIYGDKVLVVVENEKVWPLQSVVSWN